MTEPARPTRPDDYTQVSSHLKAAGEEVAQLLDLLTDGLADDEQGHRPRRGTDRDGRGPRAGEPR